MTVKVIYLNGCWEYIRNVKSIGYETYEYRLELSDGSILEFDGRLRLEVEII